MTNLMHPSLRARYDDLLTSGHLRLDAAQMDALLALERFSDHLSGYKPPSPHFWKNLFLSHASRLATSGLYLFGDGGRGKSMLMDLFFDTVPVLKKRRVHFHQFMLEIHERLHELAGQDTDDVIERLAHEILKDAWLLCFDEFHVSNIADAMILGRLFKALFAAGALIVTTSNWAPDDLYKNGLQRERFLPFIQLIKSKMMIFKLRGEVDHRFEQMHKLKSFFTPLGDETTRTLQGIFLNLTDEAPPEALSLPVQGRKLKITHAARGVGFFNFDELCKADLGAADYLAVAKCLHTVILDGVPRLGAEERNETTRFMTLIDTLYEAKVKLFLAAALPLPKLVVPGDLAFAFQRTISRLNEMQSAEYARRRT